LNRGRKLKGNRKFGVRLPAGQAGNDAFGLGKPKRKGLYFLRRLLIIIL
jgi:hypothetical protein